VRGAAAAAAAAVAAAPGWAKAHFRLGAAAWAGRDWEAAAGAYEKAGELLPRNGQADAAVASAAAGAAAAAAKGAASAGADAALAALAASTAAVATSTAATVASMTHQFRAAAAAPDWGMDAYAWRPAVALGDRLVPAGVTLRAAAAATDPHARPDTATVAALAGAAGDLAGVRRAVAAAGDAGRMDGWAEGVGRAVGLLVGRGGPSLGGAAPPAPPPVALSLGGGPVAALLAAAAAATPSLTTILAEPTPLATAFVRAGLDQQPGAPAWAGAARLSPSGFGGLRVAGEAGGGGGGGGGGGAHPSPTLLPAPAALVVTDLWDHTPLGAGALAALDAAAGRGLLAPTVTVLPSRLVLRGVVVADVRGGRPGVRGDPHAPAGVAVGAALDGFRWGWAADRVDFRVGSGGGGNGGGGGRPALPAGLVPLSAPFTVLDLDLTARARAAVARRGATGGGEQQALAGAGEAAAWWEGDAVHPTRLTLPPAAVTACAVAAGAPAALLTWVELDLGGGVRVSPRPPPPCPSSAGPAASPATLTHASAARHARARTHRAASLGGGLHWLSGGGPCPVGAALAAGGRGAAVVLPLRVRWDADHLVVSVAGRGAGRGAGAGRGEGAAATATTTVPAPPLTLPSAWLPRWHWDMVADTARAEAYAAALGRVLGREGGGGPAAHVVLDAGAGTGLLGLLAARAGAAAVTCVEASPALAAAAAGVVAAAGHARTVRVVAGDVRRATAGGGGGSGAAAASRRQQPPPPPPPDPARPPGTPPTLPAPADALVFEVFDAGLIGEGALHIVAAVKARGLLRAGAPIIPARACVWAQAIEVRAPAPTAPRPPAPGPSVSWAFTRPFRARAEYEALDMRPGGSPALPWRPLTRPVRAFAWDFAASPPGALLAPGRATLAAPALAPGTIHAVLFWFDLIMVDREAGGSGGGGGGGGGAPPLTLSTSPHARPAGPRPSWGQALAWLPPAAVGAAGDTIALEATHDTYGIAFSHSDAGQQAVAGGRAAHFLDPTLEAAASAAASAARAVAAALAHDPRAGERLARGALVVGARPGEWGLDGAAAAGVCGGLVGG
jgi:hypothetical protein